MPTLSWFRGPERGIGRGERAESRLEAPLFAVFMILSGIALFLLHIAFQNVSLTIALAASMLVFGVTVARVEYGIYILAVAMLLSPEIQAGAVGQHSERGVAFRYDDVLIIVIFLGVLVKTAFEKKPMLWRPNPINAGIVAYYGVCIIATLDALRVGVAAWDPSVAAFEMVKMLEFYMVFFMVGLAVDSKHEVRRQLIVFFAVALVVSLYAIGSMGRLDRVSAPFEGGDTEPNTLGGYLILVVCAAVGLLLNAPTPRLKLLFAALGITAFVPLIETLSRASYASLIVAMFALSIIGRKPLVMAALVACLLLSPIVLPEDAKQRVLYTFQHEYGEPIVVAGRDTNLQVDKSTYERIYVWEKVRYNLTVWPWLGGGVSWETVLDSQYARVLLETGLIGFTAFLFLMWRISRTTREAYRWSRDWVLKGMTLGLSAAFVGLLVHGLGTISFLIVRIMEPFWFLTALTVVARAIAIREHAAKVKQEREAPMLTAQAATAA